MSGKQRIACYIGLYRSLTRKQAKDEGVLEFWLVGKAADRETYFGCCIA